MDRTGHDIKSSAQATTHIVGLADVRHDYMIRTKRRRAEPTGRTRTT
jgi:hypothetical protein